jgi:hypothetical protein
MTQQYGFTDTAMLILYVFLFSTSIAVCIGIASKKSWKIAVVSFFMLLSMFALIGAIDWIYIVIPLILVSAFIYTRIRGGATGGD